MKNRTLAIVFFTVLLDLIGFGLIIPIQPFLAETLGAPPSVITLLGASFSLMQLLFAPFWGRLSDRIGRRPVLLISIGLTAFGYLVFGLADQLWLLFAARMLSGFGGANLGAAQAIIADSTTPENRAKGMGLIGAAFGLGFILGPALGGYLGQFGLSTPALAAAGLSALNLVFAVFCLPETYPPEKRAAQAKESGSSVVHGKAPLSLKAIRHAGRHLNVRELFLFITTYTVAFSLMEQVLALFVERYWVHGLTGLTPREGAQRAALLTANILIVVGVTATIVQGGLIGRLVKKFGEKNLLYTGGVILIFTYLAIPWIGKSGIYPLMLVNAAFMAMGSGVINPSWTGLLSRSVDPNEQGGVLGLGQGLGALGRVIGPTMAGTLFQLDPRLPFWVGSVLLLVCVHIAGKLQPTPYAPATAPAH